MFINNYTSRIEKYIRLYEKLIVSQSHTRRTQHSGLRIVDIEITFELNLKNKLNNKIGFASIMLVLDKTYNSITKLLIKPNHKKRTIHVGCILNIKNEQINIILSVMTLHTLPKITNNEILYELPKARQFSYTTNKIVSNLVFGSDKDISHYYNILKELAYVMILTIRTSTEDGLKNMLLLSEHGLHMHNFNRETAHLINDEMQDSIQREAEEINEYYEEFKRKTSIDKIENKKLSKAFLVAEKIPTYELKQIIDEESSPDFVECEIEKTQNYITNIANGSVIEEIADCITATKEEHVINELSNKKWQENFL